MNLFKWLTLYPGAAANREVMQALATLSHFNNITGGNLFGEGGYAGGVSSLVT